MHRLASHRSLIALFILSASFAAAQTGDPTRVLIQDLEGARQEERRALMALKEMMREFSDLRAKEGAPGQPPSGTALSRMLQPETRQVNDALREAKQRRMKAEDALRSQLRIDEARLASLQEKFTPQWPEVLKQQQHVRRLRAALASDEGITASQAAETMDRETLVRPPATEPRPARSVSNGASAPAGAQAPDPLERLVRLMDRPDKRAADVVQARDLLEELGALAVPSLRRVLPQLGPVGRLWALDFLGRHDGAAAKEVFESFLRGEDATLRLAAARSLKSLPSALRVRFARLALEATEVGVLRGGADALLRTPGHEDDQRAWSALRSVISLGASARRAEVLELIGASTLRDRAPAAALLESLCGDADPNLARQAWETRLARARTAGSTQLLDEIGRAPQGVRTRILERWAKELPEVMALALEDPNLRPRLLEAALKGAAPVAPKHRAWAIREGSTGVAYEAMDGYEVADAAMIEAALSRLEREETNLAPTLVAFLLRVAPQRLAPRVEDLVPWLPRDVLPRLLDAFCDAKAGDPLSVIAAVGRRRGGFQRATGIAVARILTHRIRSQDMPQLLSRCRVPVPDVMMYLDVHETLTSVVSSQLDAAQLGAWLRAAPDLQSDLAIATFVAASRQTGPEHDGDLAHLIEAAVRRIARPVSRSPREQDRTLLGEKLLESALNLVQRVGGGRSFERLGALVEHENASVAQLARTALRNLAGQGFEPAALRLVELATQGSPGPLRENLRSDLARIVGELPPELRRRGLLGLLQPPRDADLTNDVLGDPLVLGDAELRRAAVAAIPSLEHATDAVRAFLGALPAGERDTLVRRLLGQDASKRPASSDLRAAALEALVGETGITIEQLGAVLRQDRDVLVRRIAARSLATRFTREAAQQLVHGLRDPSSSVRQEAREGLKTMNEFLVAQEEWK